MVAAIITLVAVYFSKNPADLDHNFGHGKKHLSMNFFLLNLLAFFMHQIFELTDKIYKGWRDVFSNKEEFWNNLRSAMRMLTFPDWMTMLKFTLRPSGYS